MRIIQLEKRKRGKNNKKARKGYAEAKTGKNKQTKTPTTKHHLQKNTNLN